VTRSHGDIWAAVVGLVEAVVAGQRGKRISADTNCLHVTMLMDGCGLSGVIKSVIWLGERERVCVCVCACARARTHTHTHTHYCGCGTQEPRKQNVCSWKPVPEDW
jgi:hypothetical protein